MKTTLGFVLTVVIVLISIQNVFSQAGQLDNTFGVDGIAMYDLSGDMHETIWDMETLQDSTILLCGTVNVGNVGITDGFLLKLATNGSIDESWGDNGMVTFDLGEDTYAYKMEVLPDYKILVCGTAFVTASDSEFFVTKFNSDGTLDTDFGIEGSFISSYSSFGDEGYCMTIQNDGKIVLGGTTGWNTSAQMLFIRVNPNGSIDDTFGNNGYAEINSSTQSENIKGVDILSDGSIVGVGYAYQGNPTWVEIAAIVMLNEDGSPLSSFGNNGLLIPSWVDSFSYINDVEIKDDFIYITGWIQEVDNDIFLAKLDANGDFDPSFATDGVAYFDLNIIDNAFDMYFGPDQKIYLCGNTGSPGAGASKEFLLVRYQLDGNIDSSLNSTGHVETEIRVDSDAAFSVKLQADGKIVLAGMSSGITTTQGNNVAIVRYLNDFIPINADFVANPTEICEGENVEFTDQSIGNVLSWNWFFEGGSPEISSDQNPVVYYETSGVFDVRLIVSDGLFNDTLLVEDLIIVDECIGIDENFDRYVTIYPNPAVRNILNITVNDPDQIESFQIMNATGQVITTEQLPNRDNIVDIGNLTNGIYMVKIVYRNSSYQIEKLIVK